MEVTYKETGKADHKPKHLDWTKYKRTWKQNPYSKIVDSVYYIRFIEVQNPDTVIYIIKKYKEI
jgi:hypothetical protein